jgi:hypothetical protein
MGALHDGFVAVTPLHLDLTHHRALAQMQEWSTWLNSQFRPARAPSA